jgi:hypothetical protein
MDATAGWRLLVDSSSSSSDNFRRRATEVKWGSTEGRWRARVHHEVSGRDVAGGKDIGRCSKGEFDSLSVGSFYII